MGQGVNSRINGKEKGDTVLFFSSLVSDVTFSLVLKC